MKINNKYNIGDTVYGVRRTLPFSDVCLSASIKELKISYIVVNEKDFYYSMFNDLGSWHDGALHSTSKSALKALNKYKKEVSDNE